MIEAKASVIIAREHVDLLTIGRVVPTPESGRRLELVYSLQTPNSTYARRGRDLLRPNKI